MDSLQLLLSVRSHPEEVSGWVSFFDRLAPEFPADQSADKTWHSFWLGCSPWPIGLLVVGTVIALGVLKCLCCHGSRPDSKPSKKPMMLLVTLTFICIAIGSITYWQTGSKATNTILDQADRAIADLTKASEEGSKAIASGKGIVESLDAIMPNCPPNPPSGIEQNLAAMRTRVVIFVSDVSKFVSLVQPLPRKVQEAKEAGQNLITSIAVALIVPLLLVLLCCIILFLVEFSTVPGNQQCFRFAAGCVQFVGPILLTPTAIIVSTASAAELLFGVAVGSFCRRADTNALATVEHYAGGRSTIFTLSQYYIASQYSELYNPLLEELHDAQSNITDMQTTLNQWSNTLETLCKPWKATELKTNLSRVKDALAVEQTLVVHSNIHSYYETSIQSCACKTLPEGLGWLVVVQVIAGLVLLPCLTLAATRFFAVPLQRRTGALREIPLFIQGAEEDEVVEVQGLN